jgi:methyl-accepting chemotaxis protein
MLLNRISISTKFIWLLFLIIGLNGCAYYFVLQNIYQQELKSQAKTVVANVEAFGAWVAQGGRVWVKDSSSNSYLSKATFTSGNSAGNSVHFYSKNPALAQREFSEVVGKSASPAKFRMTSHNVMNPVNAPDKFERLALDIVRGSKLTEYSEFQNGQYRYAKAIHHTASCIVCHGDANAAPADVIGRYGNQNGFDFKEGDVAGVISVRIPAAPLYQNMLSLIGLKEIFLIALSFIIAFWFVRSSLIAPIKQLTAAAQNISTGVETPIDTTGISPNSHNEIHQLTLALSRMRNSTYLAMKKMREAKTAAYDLAKKKASKNKDV